MTEKDQILEFFKYYPVDHWIYKVNMLRNIIENFDSNKELLIKDLLDVNDKDCINMLKAEIHFTLFQMIETLFELIFALEKRDDSKLWLYLSTSDWKKNFGRINRINKGKIDFLDNKIRLSSGKEIKLIHYLFYFGIDKIPIEPNIIEKNFEKIKKIIIIFAEIFSDRIEYNAYKHSLRFFQTPIELEFGELKDDKNIPILKFESEDTLTFISNDKGKISIISKSFDYELDIKKIEICHHLILNIINSRKWYFYNREGKVKLAYFFNIDFSDLNKPRYSFEKIEYTIGWIKKKKLKRN